MPQPFWETAGPIAIAHRGGDAAGKDKENTLEAFQAAAKHGYKYAETDIILTATGEPVLIHGSHNFILAGLNRDITRRALQKMTLQQLQAFVRPGGARVPTLEEVLEALPKMNFVLDLKTAESIEPLTKLVKRLKVAERICVTGFDYKMVRRFAELCGRQKVSLGLTVGRGLRFRNMNMFMLKSGQLRDLDTIFMHHSLISAPMLSLVHHRGFKAVVWTANSSLSIRHALRSGADGIISDRISLLKQVIDKRER